MKCRLIKNAEFNLLDVRESNALILCHFVDVVVVSRDVVSVSRQDQYHVHVILGWVT